MLSLPDKDVIGLAETGSGKTGAFGLPVLQALIARPQRLFALVLTPTRELAFQIKDQFEALGKLGAWLAEKHGLQKPLKSTDYISSLFIYIGFTVPQVLLFISYS